MRTHAGRQPVRDIPDAGLRADIYDPHGVTIRKLVVLAEKLLADAADRDRETGALERPGPRRVPGNPTAHQNRVQRHRLQIFQAGRLISQERHDLAGSSLDPRGTRHEVDRATVRRHNQRKRLTFLPQSLESQNLAPLVQHPVQRPVAAIRDPAITTAIDETLQRRAYLGQFAGLPHHTAGIGQVRQPLRFSQVLPGIQIRENSDFHRLSQPPGSQNMQCLRHSSRSSGLV